MSRHANRSNRAYPGGVNFSHSGANWPPATWPKSPATPGEGQISLFATAVPPHNGFYVNLPIASCRVCGCTDTRACINEQGDSCYWVEPDLCSQCGVAGSSAAGPNGYGGGGRE